MSGRGYGRGKGKGGGKGRGGFKNNKKASSTPSKKKSLEDYWFYLGAKQASDYEATRDFIINHIQTEYKCADIISTLENLEMIDTEDRFAGMCVLGKMREL